MKNAFRLTSLVLALGFGASTFAGSDQPQVKVMRAKKYRACYVMTTASGIPVPCDRIRGIPTTGSPMDVIGNKSPN